MHISEQISRCCLQLMKVKYCITGCTRSYIAATKQNNFISQKRKKKNAYIVPFVLLHDAVLYPITLHVIGPQRGVLGAMRKTGSTTVHYLWDRQTHLLLGQPVTRLCLDVRSCSKL